MDKPTKTKIGQPRNKNGSKENPEINRGQQNQHNQDDEKDELIAKKIKENLRKGHIKQ